MATKKQIRASVKGTTTDYGYFDSNAGGEADSTETKYTGVDGVQRTSVSEVQDGNVTLAREYRRERDAEIVKTRRQKIGETVNVIPEDKDSDGNWQQNAAPYTGVIKTITPPEGDSNSNDTAMLTIVISTGAAV
jgi:hypothetical protein